MREVNEDHVTEENVTEDNIEVSDKQEPIEKWKNGWKHWTVSRNIEQWSFYRMV